jgi:RsiW-degrading membrane proteinase PrsW (M82 family)
MHTAAALAIGAVPLLATGFAWRRVRATRDTPASRAVTAAALGYALAWACQAAETALWSWTGLSLVATPGNESEALLAMFLFAAPLEEGAKVLSIWPMYTTRRLLFVRHGIVLSAAAGAGFAAGEATAILAQTGQGGLAILRVLIAMTPHVLCATMWGSMLGARARTGGFAVTWLSATLLHGVFDHIVFGRGPGVMAMAIPVLFTMLALTYAIARRARSREAAGESVSMSEAARRPSDGWSEPASVREVWRALQPRQQPLMLQWIAVGTLVTAGVGLAALAGGLYAGHLLGLDFATADEADVRSNGPLLFLATSVGAAFPASGYLVARASGTRSVLEPAMGAALAVLGAVLFLSMTTPIAAVFALAVTPIGFVLASGGAWFGISR